MVESEKGKEAKKNLADEFEKLKKNLVQRQDELQKMKDALEKQTTTMTPEARADKEKQYQTKMKDYQRMQSDYETDLRQKDQEFTQKILKELEEVVKGLGESRRSTPSFSREVRRESFSRLPRSMLPIRSSPSTTSRQRRKSRPRNDEAQGDCRQDRGGAVRRR